MKKVIILIIVISIFVLIIGGYFVLKKFVFPEHLRDRAGRCGDGICDQREKLNPNLCPKDCGDRITSLPTQTISPTPTSTISPSPTISPAPTISPTPTSQATLTKLKFVYVIHVEGPKETRPWSKEEFNYIKNAVESIANVLERHQAKGTFLFVRRAAEAAWNYQGEANLLRKLEEKGHEVGMHSHKSSVLPGENLEDYVASVRETILRTGVKNLRTFEGNITDDNNRGATELKLVADAGFTVSGGSSARALVAFNKTVEGNTPEMADATGALLHPRRPDYLNNNPLEHNPKGKIVAVDHVSPDAIHQTDEPSITLEERDFSQLKKYFDKTFNYLDPRRVNSWGFVTHQYEYTTHRFGLGPVDQKTLDYLDSFLSYVDKFVSQGKVEYMTSAEVADVYIESVE